METTITTLLWAFIYLIRNPEVQKMVQNELDEKVGRDRDVLLDDRKSLPYTSATINASAHLYCFMLLFRKRSDWRAS
jgi:cytochrome P450